MSCLGDIKLWESMIMGFKKVCAIAHVRRTLQLFEKISSRLVATKTQHLDLGSDEATVHRPQ